MGALGRRWVAAAGIAGLLIGTLAVSASAVTPLTTERVSLTDGDTQPTTGAAGTTAISLSGQYVGFQTLAAGMTAVVDANGVNDVFVRDAVAASTTLVSLDSTGGVGNAASTNIELAGGAGVTLAAFQSQANDLSALDGDTGVAAADSDIFVRDFSGSAAAELISVDATGTASGDNASTAPDISDDGRYVVFQSTATNLVTGDNNGQSDVFLRDRVTGTTTRVSVATGGAQATGASTNAVVSGDGGTVAFLSTAPDLVAGDTNAALDVFVHEVATGTTTRVSVDSAGAQSAGAAVSTLPALSADGTVVAFASSAADLVTGDTNAAADVFVRDRAAGITERVSVDSTGAQHNGTGILAAARPVLDATGRLVAFDGTATDLVPLDSNGVADVFVHDRVFATTDRVSVATGGAQADNGSVVASLSPDGATVAYQSGATNLVTGDTNGLLDAFRTVVDVPPLPPTGPVYVVPEPDLVLLMTDLAAAIPDLEVATLDGPGGTFAIPGCSTTTSPLPSGRPDYVALIAGDPYLSVAGTTVGPLTADCVPDAVTVFDISIP